ncbi:hypothetical protein BASA50_006558 [Batrachochytrium salamandrivorans]|uniref:Gamma-glutamyltransferase n=1 Tax=Batrachochytrium salamandrivorans TaxID=1357716 RepID=A0ABQ8FCY3_9FUNG|nr:hypothetical protein BASA62_009202 [Batrachochytrium salamandrivorans]KAH6577210.1 hypothetical protein BASA60_004145 [Batrachochytrium salamandrivorans]KAH6582901.1 hypothetical protein BASA61_008313 [Batrachochytrium salamandrivorans]KAH6594609.1 hypothetical protein BASA50_006558 [Batrachochytrium salamandrivorans]KAH9252501.1 gamma-glutamyltransferase [Batrachochytrium salamandrivorans]
MDEFQSRRSVVFGTAGMVAATQPLAVQAGLRILDKGGNAADAAVAVAACLNVTEPTSTGIGGDMFCLYYNAQNKTVQGLNASGKSPNGLSLEVLRKAGITDTIPTDSVHSVTVPGAAAGWEDTLKHFGSGRISLSDALSSAIDLAEQGFPISQVAADMWKRTEAKIRTVSPNSNDFSNAPIEAGAIVKLPGLARTLRLIAEHSSSAFYKGPLAKAIVAEVESRGGLLSLQDMADHTSVLTESISMEYQGTLLHEHAPNGQGMVALIALGIIKMLEKCGRIPPISSMTHNSPQYLHIIIECLRIAFVDGFQHIADPDLNPAPISKLLSEEYLNSRSHVFDPEKASLGITKGIPPADTVYLSVVDSDGNACSLVNSVYTSFGSGIIVPGTGIALQSRGANFSLLDGHPNAAGPSKRPYHTIIPAMLTEKVTGDLIMSYGVMGGFMQPQGHLQVLLNVLNFGMNPQQALDAPRICLIPDKQLVMLEDGISNHTAVELTRLGHTVQPAIGNARSIFGRGQIIKIGPHGVRMAGSDPRADGHAAPQL